MRTIVKAIAAGALLLATASVVEAQDVPAVAPTATATPAGIPMDSPWRRAVYEQAHEHFRHPSWGWRHSERDYLFGMAVAQAEGLAVDPDVMFAAAFLHDWGGIEPFAVAGVDHAVRSVQLAEPFLTEAGFPMEKFPAVRAAILGHMYDKEPEGPEALVLHDADALDFLGALGAARLLAATGDRPDYDQALGRIERFAVDIPPRLKTAAARRMAEPRVAVMTEFLAMGAARNAGRRQTLTGAANAAKGPRHERSRHRLPRFQLRPRLQGRRRTLHGRAGPDDLAPGDGTARRA